MYVYFSDGVWCDPVLLVFFIQALAKVKVPDCVLASLALENNYRSISIGCILSLCSQILTRNRL